MEFIKMRGVPEGYIGITIDDQRFVLYSSKQYTPQRVKYMAQRVIKGIYEGRRWFLAGIIEETDL